MDTIVCLGSRHWKSLWRTTHQIMSRLARDFRVIYIEPGRTPEGNQISHLLTSIRNFGSPSYYEPVENLYAISGVPNIPQFRKVLPKTVLQTSYALISNINYWYNLTHIRQVLRQHDVKNPILWYWGFGDYGSAAGRFLDDLDYKISCYLVYDETPDFAHNANISTILRETDNDLSKRVDFILGTSKTQVEKRLPLNSSTYFMPNGVDFNRFHKPLVEKVTVPADIANLPKPVIAYSGWIGYHIDVPLLNKIAEAYPSGSVVFIGPDELNANDPEVQMLKKRRNVHFLGRKEPAEMPSYFQVIDVALLPYVPSGHVYAAYPLTLHEYLSVGRSVVATDLQNLRPHDGIIRVAKTHEQFLDGVAKSIGDYGEARVRERFNLARQYDWDTRVSEIKEIIFKKLSSAPAVESGLKAR